MLQPRRPVGTDFDAGRSRKTWSALIYIIPAVAITGLLITAFFRSNKALLLDWLLNNIGNLFGALTFVVVGCCALCWPNILLSWARASHPQIRTESEFARLTARLIGAGLLVIGLLILSHL